METMIDARELAYREQDGLEVALLWWQGADDRLFDHPFAHAARAGLV
jgi:hypothetical protein